jgi:hypothetical protein
MPHAVAASGVQLIQHADALLARSAARIARGDGLPDALLDVLDARVVARSGAVLVRAERDTTQAVLDILV